MSDPPAAPASVVLRRVRVPLRRPHRSAHGSETIRDVVVVEWRPAHGPSGWAECPTLAEPGYVTETTAEAFAALAERLAPAALRGEQLVVEAGCAAAAALLDARLDAELRAEGGSLVERIGATAAALERCTVLAAVGDGIDDVVQRALVAVEDGASMVKLKVSPATGVGPLRALIDAVDVPVAADGNGSFEDLDQLDAIDRLGLAYLEQPFPAALGLDALAGLHAALDTPVALDESLLTVDDLARAIDLGAIEVASIKPARIGGVLAAARAVSVAEAAGVDAFVGGMVELGVGRAAAAAVGAMEGCTLPTDLGPSAQYVERDICEPLVIDGSGRLVVPDGPGSGRRPTAELERRTVDRVELRAS